MAHVRTANRQLMREVNTSLVLDLVRTNDSLSQAEIAKRTGLSAGTVASIVKELRSRNLVEEIGPGESTGGRKPTMLRASAWMLWQLTMPNGGLW